MRPLDTSAALGSLREMTSQTQPNLVIREAAQWVLDAASVPLPRRPRAYHAPLPGPDHRANTFSVELLRYVGDIVQVDPPASMGIVETYDQALLLNAPPALSATNARRALSEWSAGTGPVDSDPIRERVVPLVEYTLRRVAVVMGPRTERVVRALESDVSETLSLVSRLRSVIGSNLACPGSRLSDLAEEVAEFTSRSYELVVDAPAGINKDGCLFLGEFAPHSGLWRLRICLNECTEAAGGVAASMSAAEVSAVVGRDWPQEARQAASTTMWHLARSRRGPELWS